MRWTRDLTGRFSRRPYYEPHELDSACDHIVTKFLVDKYGEVRYPISTDDLTIMLEKEVVDLDLYYDFQNDETVEGVTEFDPQGAARVKISRRISEIPHMVNRFRTTLTHELFHVRFHGILFVPFAGLATSGEHKAVCKRQFMVNGSKSDWMEWQAAYGCGAILMPISALKTEIRTFFLERAIPQGARLHTSSSAGHALIVKVMAKFKVSYQAATIRLMQHNALTNRTV